MTEEQERLWYCSFKRMWIDVPVPFEAGDVLCYVPHAGRDERFVPRRGPCSSRPRDAPACSGVQYCDI